MANHRFTMRHPAATQAFLLGTGLLYPRFDQNSSSAIPSGSLNVIASAYP